MRSREALLEGSLRSLRLERQVAFTWSVGLTVGLVVLVTLTTFR